MSLRYSITVAVLAMLPIAAVAQEPVKSSVDQLVPIGSQVRIESSVVMGRLRGRIVALDDRVVGLLITDGGVVKIPVPSITAWELHVGKRRHTLQGLGIGAAIGLAFSSSFGRVDPNDCGDTSDAFCSRGELVAASVVGYGVLGAFVGWLVTTDRWATVNVSTVTPQIRHGHAGLKLSATVCF